MSLTLTAIALVIVLVGGYAWGHARARRIQMRLAANLERAGTPAAPAPAASALASESAHENVGRASALPHEMADMALEVVRTPGASEQSAASRQFATGDSGAGDAEERANGAPSDAFAAERARIARSYEGECAALRSELATARAEVAHLADLDAERRAMFDALAVSRAETARYRQLVLDIENTAPPPLLGGPGTPDDLKLIVGIGPVLERMLHQLGITTYRQIGRWTERDIDDFDARLQEFPGRIRRDGWVTQARALHQSVHGEALTRERG
jgi:predicted flap endonuclease-1-like 5' DNA nuclease